MACTQKTFYSRSKDLGELPDFGNWRRYLSNFCTEVPFHVNLSGIAGVSVSPEVLEFQSVEHAFQAVKWTYSDKPVAVMHFTTADRRYRAPLQAKRAGGRKAMATAGATLDVERWNNHREAAMRGILQARFKQDEQFRSIVLEVQRRGWRLQHFEPRVAASKAFWGGDKNTLGNLLMQLEL